eukprot:TRINITY_DN20224_c3_g1_i1.p1 TRINITY_DN20224_c3_g1~~TRINITY_DN20224_c3_g1_i1.p1  ORF type:complete len:220 (-),score=51.44 TRINITY_DN20224_c3_g1_i1:195-815(-)
MATPMLLILILVVFANADKLEVKVYEGPTECDHEDTIERGNTIRLRYTGTIDESSKTGEPGKTFDSTDRHDQGFFEIPIGVGEVITGWDAGLIGICKGAKASLRIPPRMAYGDEGAGELIPPGATLHFDVEILNVDKTHHEKDNIFKDLDLDEDGKISKGEATQFFGGLNVHQFPFEDEDMDGDGFISWKEFKGPKGSEPPKNDEL